MSLKTIDVLLTFREEKDVLIFQLDDAEPEKYCVNLNSETSQNELKAVFAKLLETLMVENVELRLVTDVKYKTMLYIEVCGEYISALNQELVQVKRLINEELE